ncbi:hypothetical protein [Arsenicicoccus dermatophilus]|uniref:hypothetical protein n=1 Tax=Arsenicicoccus dermatophilus TaxID=1076331 RepID=UPI003916FBF5
MRDGSASTEFAAALHEAVHRRGLPLSRVQVRLASMGHPVAVSTISQWQRGHRVPRSERSLAVVDALEQVLDAPRGSLRALALAVPPAAPGAGRPQPLAGYDATFRRLVAELGLGSSYPSVETVSAHEHLTLLADRTLRRRTTLAVRATCTTDRHAVAHEIDPGGDVHQVTVRAGGGCRLGRVLRDPAAGVVVAELHFDRWLGAGDTAVLQTQVEDTNQVPRTEFFRWSTHPVPVLVLEATFDRAMVPTTVQAFSRPRVQAPDRTCDELPITGGDRVHLVRQPAEPGNHGLRWTWPDP